MSEADRRIHGLYLDEDALGLARPLRTRGWGVHSCTQSDLTAATDPRQLNEAVRLQRVLISYNRLDFRTVHEAWLLAGGQHPGILSYHGGANVETDSFADAIDHLLRDLSPADLRNTMLIWHPIDRRWRRFAE